jgi:hypothetical protein
MRPRNQSGSQVAIPCHKSITETVLWTMSKLGGLNVFEAGHSDSIESRGRSLEPSFLDRSRMGL